VNATTSVAWLMGSVGVKLRVHSAKSSEINFVLLLVVRSGGVRRNNGKAFFRSYRNSLSCRRPRDVGCRDLRVLDRLLRVVQRAQNCVDGFGRHFRRGLDVLERRARRRHVEDVDGRSERVDRRET